ncbi:hypothetical protein V8C42DRAFT_306568 [Trichoderma barbatum]
MHIQPWTLWCFHFLLAQWNCIQPASVGASKYSRPGLALVCLTLFPSCRTTILTTKGLDGTSALALAACSVQSVCIAARFYLFSPRQPEIADMGNGVAHLFRDQATGAPLNPIWWASESKTPAT